MKEMKFRFLQFFIAIDQLVNTTVGLFIGGSYADETISSRAHREHRRCWVNVIDAIFFWQKSHCFEAYMSERKRLQSPPEVRNETA